MRPTKILLVEDDQPTAELISDHLTREGYAVERAPDGRVGLDLAGSNAYDAAVVDVMLPEMDGFEMVRQLRSGANHLPVLFLSAKGRLEDRVSGLELGGDDYLVKPFAMAELVARLQALVRRSSGKNDPLHLKVADLEMDLQSRKVFRGGEPVELRPREFQLLAYLMRNAGRVVSRAMIMDHVWDFSFDPSSNVVEACLCRLRDRVDRGHGPALIHTIRGSGYMLREPN